MLPARDFEFNAGAPSLNFVDTVADRDGQAAELLARPADLDRWLGLAGLVPHDYCGADRCHLRRAQVLREAIHRTVRAAVAGSPPDQADVDLINRTALATPARPQLIDGDIVMTADLPVEAALSALSADVIERLGARRRQRLRACPDCRMLFFDSSRPGRRIWCSSASGCGNRAKVRRHRARRAKPPQGAGQP